MSEKNNGFTSIPYPRIRQLMVDGGRLGRQKHTIHGLVEVDVTLPRQLIREHKARSGEKLSFSAFIMACLGKAVDMNRPMQAYRSWRNQLIIFEDVDVNTMFEVEVDGKKIIRPHIIRAANHKSLLEIHEEIRVFQAQHEGGQEARFIRWFVWLPAFIRRTFLGTLFKNPHWLKEMNGTVSLTAVGMFGSGVGWGIPVTTYTLQVTLGGIAEKAGVVDGRIEAREMMSLTVSFDHDIVDGAPAARFIQRFKELIESGYGLCE